MRPLHSLASFFAVLGLLLVAVAGGLAPHRAAAQLPTADLALQRLNGSHHARVGNDITFRVLATNLGPETSQLDVTVSFSGGLELNQLQCDRGVSPDTPSCEYSNVAPGVRLTTLVVAHVLAGAGPTETITVCTGNEGLNDDPNPANDCSTLTIGILGG